MWAAHQKGQRPRHWPARKGRPWKTLPSSRFPHLSFCCLMHVCSFIPFYDSVINDYVLSTVLDILILPLFFKISPVLPLLSLLSCIPVSHVLSCKKSLSMLRLQGTDLAPLSSVNNASWPSGEGDRGTGSPEQHLVR